MTEVWTALDNFVNDQVVKNADMRPILANVEFLKNKGYADNLNEIGDDNVAQTISSVTNVLITSEKYTLDVETQGGDLCVYVALEVDNTVDDANTELGVSLKIDDVYIPAGLTDDPADLRWVSRVADGVFGSLFWIAQGLVPGEHTITLYGQRVTATNQRVWSNPRNFVVAWEI